MQDLTALTTEELKALIAAAEAEIDSRSETPTTAAVAAFVKTLPGCSAFIEDNTVYIGIRAKKSNGVQVDVKELTIDHEKNGESTGVANQIAKQFPSLIIQR